MGAAVYFSTIYVNTNIGKLLVGFVVGVAFYYIIAKILKDESLSDYTNIIKE